MTRKHLIIGAGTAALTALEEIRKASPQDEIVMVTPQTCPPYSPTSLPYLLAGRIMESHLWMRKADYFSSLKCTLAQGKEVVGILPEKKEVLYREGGSEGYDNLLIATGSEPVKPPIPGLESAGSLTFHTLEDCHRLQGELKSKRDIAILGAGLVGMEVAVALLEMGFGVKLIEKEPSLLPIYFDSKVQPHFQDIFLKHGAQLFLGKTVSEVKKKPDRVEIAFADGGSTSAELLITAIGVRPRTSFLKGSGIRVERGVVGDNRMRANIENIYAAGDVAQAPGFFSGQPEMSPTLPNALLQGKVAGANMAGVDTVYEGSIASNVFNFLGHTSFVAGLSQAQGDSFQVMAGWSGDGKQYKKLVFQEGRLVGVAFLDEEIDPGVILYLIKKRLDLTPHKELLWQRPKDTSRWLMQRQEKEESLPVEG